MSPATQPVDWALANPVYALGLLVGAAIGIFYGFDGWRGDTADGELKDSPRVKNLIWVGTGAVAAFFGDVHAMDPDAKKPILLLCYFIACLSAAVLVVVG